MSNRYIIWQEETPRERVKLDIFAHIGSTAILYLCAVHTNASCTRWHVLTKL